MPSPLYQSLPNPRCSGGVSLDKCCFYENKRIATALVNALFSPLGSAFLAVAIIEQRYIELDSQSKRIISIVKVRGGNQNKDIRVFDITEEGIVIGAATLIAAADDALYRAKEAGRNLVEFPDRRM